MKPETKRKKKHIFLKLIAVFLVWCIFASAVGANVIYGISFKTETTFSEADDGGERWIEQNPESVYINSADGLRLHGLFLENSGNDYVIICHGYHGRASHMGLYAKKFYAMGYSVLAVDQRAHGDSEGKVCSFGAFEQNDLILWIDKITEADKNARIVLFGLSMGAATVMLASGSDRLKENVVCAIEDSGYTAADEIVYKNVRAYTHLPYFPIIDAVDVVTRIRGGFSIKQTSCVRAVEKSKIPILFIHGASDGAVPPTSLDTLYNAAKCEKERLSVPNAGHIRSATTDPDTYWNTVSRFLEKVK